VSHIETVKTGCTDGCCAPPVVFPTRLEQSGDRRALIREAFRLEWLTIGWMAANPLLAAIAALALALAGAALAQETDSDVAGTGEQGFRRFASLCRDQKAACDAAFRFGALVGADAATRCALADDRIACFKKTMNSQEFMEEERKAITGQTDPKQ
jgi:hypothetical protein